jgi:cysteine desulfurase/selenocysteine lyase
MNFVKESLIRDCRKDFPIFQAKNNHPLIYFDSAATTQKPQSVINAMSEFMAQDYGTVHRGAYRLSAKATNAYSMVREQVKSWIGADQEYEVIFTKGTTEAINLVAYSFGELLNPGDEIILSIMEHHSNIVPWQLLAKRKNLTLRYIPINQKGELDLHSFRSFLSKNTKLISIAHVANSTGTINPIEEITSLARQTGAKIFIDGAQATAHMNLNMSSLDVDFYAFSGHKMYGPTGVGILCAKKALLNEMPPYQGGGDMINTVSLQGTTFAEPPLKFEAGTPMIAEVIGLGAAITYIASLGMDLIAAHEKELTDYLIAQLQKVPGIQLIGTAQKRGALQSFVIDGVHPLDIATLLDAKGIAIRTGHLCAQPTLDFYNLQALCRVSLGVYNNIAEIDQFIHELIECIQLIKT